MTTDRYATEQTIADIRKCSPKTLQRERLNGDGPPFLKVGGKILYDLRDFEEWMDSRKYRSTSEYAEA